MSGPVETPITFPEPARRAMASIAPVPEGLPQIEHWAEKHGVLDRLHDPIKTLSYVLYTSDPYVGPLVNGGGTLATLLAAGPDDIPSHRRGRALFRWEAQMRAQSLQALKTAARHYLHHVASIRAGVLARRDDAARRGAPPAEPPLSELWQRLEDARAQLVERVTERPIGTYLPQPAKVATEPLRITYIESADFQWGLQQVTAAIFAEEDPLRIRCDCPVGTRGPCVHMFSAIDEARDLLRVPTPARDSLASVLATPVWSRFLHSFGEGLARHAGRAREDQRLVWRIAGEAGAVKIEPLIQKRLKGGGFSAGQRVSLSNLAETSAAYTDPRDRRAVTALTAGFEEMGAVPHVSLSRARVARTLEALAGHPLAFVEGHATTPARITRERLTVALEPQGDAITVVFRVGGQRWNAHALAAEAEAEGPLILVDRKRSAVAICSIDERARALVDAFAKHPATFPAEIHDELLRALGTLQESVDLVFSDALAVQQVEADGRPVVRLSPRDDGPVDVSIVVRPVPGGPAFGPGEGATTVLHSVDGRRVAARRDLAREIADAAPLAAGLPPAVDEAAPWSYLVDEPAALDLLAVLREKGDEVVIEWPVPDRRLVLAGTAKLKELRVRVTDKRDWFGVEGEVEIDGQAVSLAMLLEAARSGRRFVRIAPGKFAELEEDLRRRVLQAGDVLHAGRKGLEVALPGVALLEGLVDNPRMLEAAVRFRDLVRRMDASKHLDPALPAGLTAELRPYQLEGYKWLMRLAAWGAGACLADDMGLGKTVQALAVLLARADRGPALVVAPTSVGQNWLDEATRFAPGLRARLYRGPQRASVLAEARPGDLLVTSYALVVRDAEALAGVRFATLVLDEAQAFKNALTRRARAIAGLDADLRMALTGTPVENHLGDLWSLMRVLTPGLLGSWDHFRDRFATPIERGKDPERLAALARVIRPFLLRRTKAEVAPELPPRTEIQRLVQPSTAERALYDAARIAALESLASGEGDARFKILAALTRLRRLACHPRLVDPESTVSSSKLAALLEIVDELREEGHRALVFSQFTTHLALVREALDKRKITYDYLDGSTPAEERARRVTAFQTGRADLFLISLKAGGSGLNLTGADYVIHLDPWWNPAVEDQATDRAHRIGQTRAVTVIRLVTGGTIEQAVLALHGEKRALAASVFDEEGSPARLSTEDLASLIRRGMEEAPADDEGDAAGEEPAPDSGPRTLSNRGRAPASAPPPSTPPSTRRSLAAPPAPAPPPPAAPEPPPPPPPPAPPAPEVKAADEKAAGPLSAGNVADRVIGWLAEQRGGVDPRYDTTLSAYARGLRRFAEYLAKRPEGGATAITEAVIDEFLTDMRESRWPVAPSQHSVVRAATNHLRAYLRSSPPQPAS
jgi:superfamily II DNA or RNA helicase